MLDYMLDGSSAWGMEIFLLVHPDVVGQVYHVARSLVTSWMAQVSGVEMFLPVHPEV